MRPVSDRPRDDTTASAAVVLAALAALAACSTVPRPGRPPFRDVALRVRYELGADRPAAFEVPQSSPDLTVLELRRPVTDCAERFVGGRRLLVPAPGVEGFEVRCRYRVWGSGDRVVLPDPTTLFPGAAAIEHEPR